MREHYTVQHRNGERRRETIHHTVAVSADAAAREIAGDTALASVARRTALYLRAAGYETIAVRQENWPPEVALEFAPKRDCVEAGLAAMQIGSDPTAAYRLTMK